MELAESIESINQLLRDHYGIDTESNQSMWRVVWANDQYEKVWRDTTPEGLHTLYPQIYEVPKYMTSRDRYILERLVLVPNQNSRELLGLKKSYEPIWTFQTHDKIYLPPKWEAAKFLVDLVLAAIHGNRGGMAKYKEDLSIEAQEERIKKLQEELFGNETSVGDSLSYGSAVAGFHSKETE